MTAFHSMKHTFTLLTALLLVPLAALAQQTTPPPKDQLVGDGIHDDTTAIQALIDSRRALVHLPAPPKHYLISKPLRIHSNQTLQLDRFAVIRLKNGSDCLMITNDDHEHGNENVALVGGVWDMHNEGQSLSEYQKTRIWKGTYDPASYLGVLMRFNRVKRLTLRSLTLKDPVTFSTQLGNLTEFTIEDITFDHNLKRTNMDGIHVHGNSRHGRITNLKGATNDDLVALNADDAGIFEMSRGAIEDIAVDGVWATDGYTAVRLLSAGSPIRRIRLANIFGTYRYNAVSFTNHKVHPGTESVFEDVSISGLFCAKSGTGRKPESRDDLDRCARCRERTDDGRHPPHGNHLARGNPLHRAGSHHQELATDAGHHPQSHPWSARLAGQSRHHRTLEPESGSDGGDRRPRSRRSGP
jgi:hypothetical protein